MIELVNMKLSLFFIVISFFGAKANTSVKVSVYYETLCPDSIGFIKNQLYANYETFGKELIQLELIPYGFEKEIDHNRTKSFTCQHGPKECFGNLVHGIVINVEPITTSVKFVYCSESSTVPTSEDNLKNCAEKNGISWSSIKQILASGKGEDIMSKNGERTRQLNPRFIPTVVFNEKFNQEDQDQAISDFKGVVCKYLNYNSDQCNSGTNDIQIIQV